MGVDLTRSRIVVGTRIPELPEVPILVAHGDPDDHLRLAVLLAQAMGRGDGQRLRDAVEVCMSPRSAWRQRLDALSYLAERAPRPEGAGLHGVLVDIDALDPGPLQGEVLWDDRDFCRQRGELLGVLVGAIGAGGWLVVRSNPSSETLERLDGTELGTLESERIEVAAEEEPLRDALEALSPECRPVLLWIVRSGVLRARDMERLVAAADPGEIEANVLGVAYDAIPGHARQAGYQIAALRGFQPYNGRLGSFVLESDLGDDMFQPQVASQ